MLRELERHLLQQGHELNHISLHDKQRRLPSEFWQRQKELANRFKSGQAAKRPIAVIDGYEQLSLLQKIKVRTGIRPGNAGLLITAHKQVRQIRVLFQTHCSPATLAHVIEHLFEDWSCEPPSMVLCRELFDRHQGNIRNILFDLYDIYETQRQ